MTTCRISECAEPIRHLDLCSAHHRASLRGRLIITTPRFIPQPAAVARQGACRDEDPELFFPIGYVSPTDLTQIDQAKAVCRRCPVQNECLQWAIEASQGHGIWGAHTPNERATIHHQQTAAHNTAVTT